MVPTLSRDANAGGDDAQDAPEDCVTDAGHRAHQGNLDAVDGLGVEVFVLRVLPLHGGDEAHGERADVLGNVVPSRVTLHGFGTGLGVIGVVAVKRGLDGVQPAVGASLDGTASAGGEHGERAQENAVEHLLVFRAHILGQVAHAKKSSSSLVTESLETAWVAKPFLVRSKISLSRRAEATAMMTPRTAMAIIGRPRYW